MKCNRCGEYRETVADVRACRGCQDGTADQIPANMQDDTDLEVARLAIPGLSNRFVTGSAPAPETTETTDAAPAAVELSQEPRKGSNRRRAR